MHLDPAKSYLMFLWFLSCVLGSNYSPHGVGLLSFMVDKLIFNISEQSHFSRCDPGVPGFGCRTSQAQRNSQCCSGILDTMRGVCKIVQEREKESN